MSKVLFLIGSFFWLVFAYDIENDRGFFTWVWLLFSLWAFGASALRHILDNVIK